MTDDSPRMTMRRQALFTPLVIAVLTAAVLVAGAIWLAYSFLQPPGTVIVTRHVEKAEQPEGNPPPSALGERRAEQLAELFLRPGVDAVFATEYLRSFATATPLARRGSLPVHVYEGRDIAGLVETVDAQYRNGTVFIVGHSNTVPDIVHAFSGRRVDAISEDRYGDVYVIVRPRWGRRTIIHFWLPAPAE